MKKYKGLAVLTAVLTMQAVAVAAADFDLSGLDKAARTSGSRSIMFQRGGAAEDAAALQAEREAAEAQENQILVKDLMYMPKTIIYRQETMEEVAKKFQNSKDYNIPVLEGEKYVGFVSRANVFSNYRVKVKEFSND